METSLTSIPPLFAAAKTAKKIVLLSDGNETRGKAIDRVLEMLHKRFEKEPVHVAAVHARDLESAQALFERARKIFNIRELIITELSVAVAANLGPGTVGLVVYPAGE